MCVCWRANEQISCWLTAKKCRKEPMLPLLKIQAEIKPFPWMTTHSAAMSINDFRLHTEPDNIDFLETTPNKVAIARAHPGVVKQKQAVLSPKNNGLPWTESSPFRQFPTFNYCLPACFNLAQKRCTCGCERHQRGRNVWVCYLYLVAVGCAGNTRQLLLPASMFGNALLSCCCAW